MKHRSRSKPSADNLFWQTLVSLFVISVLFLPASITSAKVPTPTSISIPSTGLGEALMPFQKHDIASILGVIPFKDTSELVRTDHSQIDIGAYQIYLPLVMRRCPPIPDVPVLNPIKNPDGNNSYSVNWSSAYLATGYILQEDSNASFSSPTQRYSGTGTTWKAAGKSAGTYYYRVKASNSWGVSAWSSVQKVTVTPPMAEVYVKNDTGGSLCYEVYDTGIGQKCFSSGTHFYGSFPSGTYNWRASARCGTDSGKRYYGAEEYIHRFWCQ